MEVARFLYTQEQKIEAAIGVLGSGTKSMPMLFFCIFATFYPFGHTEGGSSLQETTTMAAVLGIKINAFGSFATKTGCVFAISVRHFRFQIFAKFVFPIKSANFGNGPR